MAEQILLAPSYPGEPIDPGQQRGVLQRGDRHADRVPVTPRGSGDSLVGGEAPSAAIGIVEAPQQRPQHPSVAQVSGPWCCRGCRFAVL